ncbi:MMPL family transporter [Terasakiella sp. A23]|uniref:efflux RND transporter permease subunit n=1 Tax=Terasakiella sp. FCG-A23 TaxID=3080561 RepID=UPI0029551A81|nr:MMPL family transporter [Terasakiella sp. A23]MDV7341794.1 MMPL family transporter [Terasakiella sp. A23]
MSKFMDRLSVSWAKGIVRWRWLVLIVAVAATIGLASGARFLSFTSDYRVFFSDENPQLTAYEDLQNIYTKADNILFVLKPRDGKIFTAEWLESVRLFTEDAWKIPYSIRVDSISNYQNTEAVEDDLTVADLVETTEGLNQVGLDKIENVAQTEPVLAKRIISEDSTTTGIQVTLQLPPDDAIALSSAVEYAETMAANLEAKHPNLEVAVTGLAPLSNAFTRASMIDMGTLTPAMFVIIIVALIAFLRSFTGTAVTLLVTIFSMMVAMGFAGFTGVRLTPPAAMAPTIIMTIAIADCVHILVSMFHEMRHGKTKQEAIVESLRVNTQPVFLTSLTTVIGFMTLNFSDSPPFHDLGNISAAGVIAAWILSMTFLPAMMAILPVRVKAKVEGKSHVMDKLADFVIAKRSTLLVVMGVIVIALASMVSKIELDDRFVEYFDESIQFRVDSDFTRENLTGIYQVEYSIGSGESGGVSNPDYLAKLEEFSIWLRAQPGVVHVNTITDIMKRLNKSMHGDEQAWYKLPEDRELAAQYLLLYEMSLPYGLDLNSQINVDKSASRLTVTLDNVSSTDMRNMAEVSSQWLKDNTPTYMHAEATSTSVMFSYISDRNIKSMLSGTAIAFVMISLSMVIALRSLKIGLISLIPNMVPAAMAFGVWAILFGQVGMAVSVVAATSLGLIVDASVHFLSKYTRARRERGASPQAAVRYGFNTVGTALWVTTAVLVLGFAVLAFSTFKVNADMGILTAITIAIALFIDFLLLPPLLMLFEKEPVKEEPEGNPVPQAAE